LSGDHVKSVKTLLRQTAVELVAGKELLAQKKRATHGKGRMSRKNAKRAGEDDRADARLDRQAPRIAARARAARGSAGPTRKAGGAAITIATEVLERLTVFPICSQLLDGCGDARRGPVVRLARHGTVRGRQAGRHAPAQGVRLSRRARHGDAGVDARARLPLSRLESRLRCPHCGSRDVQLIFTVPSNVQAARASKR
jgi:hypothetical protein